MKTCRFDQLAQINADVFRRIEQDHKDHAERQWQAPTKAPVEQRACDVGLFSDDSKQTDLFAQPGKGKDDA